MPDHASPRVAKRGRAVTASLSGALVGSGQAELPDAESAAEQDAAREIVGEDPDAPDALGLPAPVPAAYVTAVVVSHDGARWLPACLAALGAQTHPPDIVVGVDTGSTDASGTLLRGWRGCQELRELPRDTGYGAAVAAGLAAVAPQPPGVEQWVWLLHDDCAPEPEALEELLRAAGRGGGAGPAGVGRVGMVGPKVRDWDDPRLLVEAGLTVDRAGRRVTGLDPGERDQGQHDVPRDVLAVGTAGALVRRETWDTLGGTDPALPLFRDDVDLGWRVVLAGERVTVAPRAVVRHVRAAATGRRTPDAVRGPARRVDREHALHVQLVNSGRGALLLGPPRLLLAGLLRAGGCLLTRRPRAAADELVACAHLVVCLPTVLRGRRWRRAQRRVPARAVAALLHPRGAHLRAGSQAAIDWLTSGPALRRAASAAGPVTSGTTAAEEEAALPPAGGGRRRARDRPGLLLSLGLVALTLVAARRLLGSGVLTGGALLPPSGGASDLWRAWAMTWHASVAGGSGTPAPPWTPWLALAATATGGRVSVAVTLLLLGSVPAAGAAAWTASRRLVEAGTPLRLWASMTYAVLPVATGAVARGHLDTAVTLVAAPLLLSAGSRLLPGAAHGPRQPWVCGLGLAVVTAFAPPVFLLAAALLAVPAAVSLARRRPGPALVVLAPLLVPPALAVPWLPRLAADPGVLLTGLGRPAGLAGLPAGAAASGTDLLALRPEAAAGGGLPPAWLVVPVLVVALAGLLRSDSRRRRAAAGLWAVGLVALAGALAASRTFLPGPAGAAGSTAWPGPAVAIAGAALVGAAVLGAGELRDRLTRRAFGWPQVATVLLVAMAAPVPVALAGSWLARGAGQPLERRAVSLLPLDVLTDVTTTDPGQRVLVLRLDPDGTIAHDLRGLGGPRLGEEELGPAPATGSLLSALVADLGSDRGTDAAETLSTFAVPVVVVLGAARSALTDALDAQPALTRRSTRSADVGVWRTTVPVARAQVLGPGLAGAALAPAPAVAGTGRGPSRADLSAAPPLPLQSGDDGVDVRVQAGEPGRLLVLAQATDPGWRASLDGHPLSPRRAWGWAQGFALPAGGGRLLVTHESRAHDLLLAGQALALLVVLVLAAPTLGRDRRTVEDLLVAPSDERPGAPSDEGPDQGPRGAGVPDRDGAPAPATAAARADQGGLRGQP